jgi:serine/threonine protein kinase
MDKAGHHLLSPTQRDGDDDDGSEDGSPKRKTKKHNRRNRLLQFLLGGKGQEQKGKGKSSTTALPEMLASRITMGDCDIVDVTDNAQLLTYRKDESILIKLQRDPQKAHVGNEIRHEALVYERLSRMKGFNNAVPSFHGYSSHPGVALLCLSREGPDFEDLGCENISRDLKMSAVDSLQCLSDAGILHGDLALRNVVQSRENPNQAKIIDFGRARFSSDRLALQEQVDALKILLGIEQ